jgi:hypothetical protein
MDRLIEGVLKAHALDPQSNDVWMRKGAENTTNNPSTRPPEIMLDTDRNKARSELIRALAEQLVADAIAQGAACMRVGDEIIAVSGGGKQVAGRAGRRRRGVIDAQPGQRDAA